MLFRKYNLLFDHNHLDVILYFLDVLFKEHKFCVTSTDLSAVGEFGFEKENGPASESQGSQHLAK